MRTRFFWLWSLLSAGAMAQPRPTNDPFLHRLYDRLHESPVQTKYRTIAPMPIGAVYVQQPGEGEAEMRAHFRTMKQLGFNALKQIMTVPGWTIEQVQLIALEEGIIPWWYGEGGWQSITPALLKTLAIPVNTPIAEVRQHPRMLAYQQELLRQRILKSDALMKATGKPLKDRSVAYEPELGGRGFDLTDRGKQLFRQWVRQQYGTIERLNQVWNQHHAGLQAGEGDPFSSWDDFEKRYGQLSNKEYRHLHDILNFKVEHSLESIRQTCERFRAFDSSAVFRGGGEIGLFHPLAWYGVDLERVADLMTRYGSFYPSIHFAWHYGEVNYELVRPFYMQASLANDFFKGGWAATWESTGGPQQFSGGRGGADFTVDEGTITQFLLSQIAAGFRGWGAWAWNARTAGWEAGEYALLDRHNQVTARAVRMGQIGQAANRYRDELWAAHKEPTVGVLYDWHNEATWAAMSESGREEFRLRPMQARVGISRALINANIPFEYVTTPDLAKGLGGRYRVLYVPAQVSLSHDLVRQLGEYARQGGRLVMDVPSGYYDEFTALLPTRAGSEFEQLTGVTIRDYQGSGVNRTYRLGTTPVLGMIATLQPTTAHVVSRFDNGQPAITEQTAGRGTAVVLGYEAARMCFRPGHTDSENQLISQVLGTSQPPYRCTDAIVYRLAAPAADHYFFINDGPARTASLTTGAIRYKAAVDALTNEPIDLNRPVALDANSSRWIRAIR
ncbi:beta-galactosidase [Spirosoma lacussanchae]|uniref:beta-galactosidase trimerization domain-containing protein n=1 Tax=Spirosoma lacussanchae TaxID=1884249 RepID=UPI00110890D7|nr:beta-galactosidase trimerization domain-containing protein [Spirosoma lacussanchae]